MRDTQREAELQEALRKNNELLMEVTSCAFQTSLENITFSHVLFCLPVTGLTLACFAMIVSTCFFTMSRHRASYDQEARVHGIAVMWSLGDWVLLDLGEVWFG